MAGLIPLKLAGGDRSSVVGMPSPKWPSRRSSLQPAPVPVSTLATKAPARRLPVVSTARAPAAPNLPKTAADWKRTIGEVKSQHINRRFRACARQCDMILSNIKDAANIEPAYLMTLHFYAATSLEMCARVLDTPSKDRDSLFLRARNHYDQAARFLQSAEEAVIQKGQTRFSFLSQLGRHSPSGSISSGAPTPMSGLSTPALSVCSSEDSNATVQQSVSRPTSLSSVKKTVSFDFTKEVLSKWEPSIRPDSPTLGFDDEYFTSPRLRQSLPETPKHSNLERAETSILPETPTQATTKRCSCDDQNAPLANNYEHMRYSYLLTGSASRYSAQLASFKTQLARHRNDLEAIMETTNEDIEPNERPSTPATAKERAADLQARIERLRKNGWQRKRFDPSRSQALRMAALAEIL